MNKYQAYNNLRGNQGVDLCFKVTAAQESLALAKWL